MRLNLSLKLSAPVHKALSCYNWGLEQIDSVDLLPLLQSQVLLARFEYVLSASSSKIVLMNIVHILTPENPILFYA